MSDLISGVMACFRSVGLRHAFLGCTRNREIAADEGAFHIAVSVLMIIPTGKTVPAFCRKPAPSSLSRNSGCLYLYRDR